MRRQLVLVTGAVTTMVVAAFLIPLALLVRDLATDRVLVSAEREAQTWALLISVTLPEQGEAGVRRLVGDGERPSGQLVSVILPDGEVVGAAAPVDASVVQASGGLAFRQEVEGGEAIFLPVVQAEGGTAVVRWFVPASELTPDVGSSWMVLGVLGVLLILLAIVVADRLARSIVEGARRLSAAAHRVAAGDLEVRVRPSGPPELVEAGGAFNRLVERIGVLLAQEREMVADLSHRLRTPLTALRLDAEALGTTEERRRLADDVDELERTVDHIIRQARRPVREGAGANVDLADVVRRRVEYWGALADEQGRRWSLEIPDGRHHVAGSASDLEAAVDALLGNVFAHTPDGTGFEVRLESTPDGMVALVVEDHGPGFAGVPALRRGASGGESTGLGLDIVRRTAEASGGTLTIRRRRGGGARVTAQFGAEG